MRARNENGKICSTNLYCDNFDIGARSSVLAIIVTHESLKCNESVCVDRKACVILLFHLTFIIITFKIIPKYKFLCWKCPTKIILIDVVLKHEHGTYLKIEEKIVI